MRFSIRPAMPKDAAAITDLSADFACYLRSLGDTASFCFDADSYLMGEAAAVCRRIGGSQLFWAVYKPNRLAFAFYDALAAEPIDDLAFMRLDVGAGEAR
jgi:hypothetical protein